MIYTIFVSNIVEDGELIVILTEGEMMFHRDGGYTNKPYKATTLYAIEVPDHGGNTVFSNQYSVYDALSPDLREKLDGMNIRNTHEFGVSVRTKERYDSTEMRSMTLPVFHPHPETGRMIVNVNELYTEEIIELTSDESRAILDEIFALQHESCFIYEHIWQPNDLVIWDNYSTLHARTDFPRDQRRLLRRFTIEGIVMEDYF